MASRLDELNATFASDPGNPLFAELADMLRQKGEHLKAIEVCLSGLSSNPECAKGRLMLARIYYERSYLPFAIGELKELARQLQTCRAPLLGFVLTGASHGDSYSYGYGYDQRVYEDVGQEVESPSERS